jgi:hypothetical protein
MGKPGAKNTVIPERRHVVEFIFAQIWPPKGVARIPGMFKCATCPRSPVEEALLAVGRLANPHRQAVFFQKIPRLSQMRRKVAHAQFKLPRKLATHPPKQAAVSPFRRFQVKPPGVQDAFLP